MSVQARIEAAITPLAEEGYVVLPHLLETAQVAMLRGELQQLDQQGAFAPAGIGRQQVHQHDARIRSDRTCWLTGESDVQQALFSFLEKFKQTVNRHLFMGLDTLEAHYAIYSQGNAYERHLDAFRGQTGRKLSVVLYLNEHWQADWGGQLRLWPSPQAQEAVVTVPPLGGTLVAFLSEQIPLEVLAAHHERYSIAGWFRCASPLCSLPF